MTVTADSSAYPAVQTTQPVGRPLEVTTPDVTWRNDWNSFIAELSPYFKRGAPVSELKEKFEGQQVSWIGSVEEVSVRPDGVWVTMKMPAKAVTLSDGTAATVDYQRLSPKGENAKKWQSLKPGTAVCFQTTLKGNSLFPVVALLQGLGPNAGKNSVVISTDDAEVIKVVNAGPSQPAVARPPAAAKRRDWWVYVAVGGKTDVSNIGPPLQGKALVAVIMEVASDNPKLISELTDKSWEAGEANSGKDSFIMATMFVLETDSIGNKRVSGTRDLGGGVTARAVKLVWIGTDLPQVLQNGRFRLRGETDWIRLSDFLEPRPDPVGCRVCRCLRCGTALDLVKSPTKCVSCNALFQQSASPAPAPTTVPTSSAASNDGQPAGRAYDGKWEGTSANGVVLTLSVVSGRLRAYEVKTEGFVAGRLLDISTEYTDTAHAPVISAEGKLRLADASNAMNVEVQFSARDQATGTVTINGESSKLSARRKGG